MLSGAETVCEINTKVRPDRALLEAFGHQRCADASVNQQTLDATTEATVLELETVLANMSREHGVVASGVSAFQTGAFIDIDLSALPIGKRSEGAKKGYISKQQNTYTRQLARLMRSDTQEMLCNELYAGDTRCDTVFKKMIGKLEAALAPDAAEKHCEVHLRFDAGFYTDANINYALWRGYQFLGKMYTSRRIQKLVASEETWDTVPKPQRHPWQRSPGSDKTPTPLCETDGSSRCENTEKRWHLELCGLSLNTHRGKLGNPRQ